MNESSNTDAIGSIARREAIRRVGMLFGGVALFGGERLLAAAEIAVRGSGTPIGNFSAADIAFLDEIADTILPETKTPGAKGAQTGAFMALMVTDCYWPDEQAIFHDGMQRIDAAAKKAHGKAFMQATPAQRLALLETFDREQKEMMDARDAAERRAKGLEPSHPPDASVPTPATHPPPQEPQAQPALAVVHAPGDEDKPPAHFFRMMKELALLGYFTSEIGCTIAQRYVETPGRYDACVPYEPGETSWASHA